MSVLLGSIHNKNLRTIELYIDNEQDLNLIKKTPALRDMFTNYQLKHLKSGKNILNVNNYIYSKLQNLDFIYVKKID